MKILFDGIATQPSGVYKIHGGGEYTKVVLKKLLERTQDMDIVFSNKEDIPSEILKLCKANNINIIKVNGIDGVGRVIENGNYDVFYSGMPYLYYNLIIKTQTKFIYTIHGLRGIETPEEFLSLKYFKGKGKIKRFIKLIIAKISPCTLRDIKKKRIEGLIKVTKNRKILTVSLHSKYSILNNFSKINADEIKVYYAPKVEYEIEKNANEAAILNKYNVQKQKYILMVNCNRVEKNCYRGAQALMELFDDEQKSMKDIKVVMLGTSDTPSFTKLTRKYSDKFVLRGYVDKLDLEILQKNAHLFFYPSLNEGFGYPPIDAMKYGTLSACSAISAVTEACGDAVLYFSPFDKQEMKVRILESFDKTIRKDLDIKMKNRYEIVNNKQYEDLDKIVDEILS